MTVPGRHGTADPDQSHSVVAAPEDTKQIRKLSDECDSREFKTSGKTKVCPRSSMHKKCGSAVNKFP